MDMKKEQQSQVPGHTHGTEGSDASPGRKPYEAPRIESREVIETVATACATSGGKEDFGSCPAGPINS